MWLKSISNSYNLFWVHFLKSGMTKQESINLSTLCLCTHEVHCGFCNNGLFLNVLGSRNIKTYAKHVHTHTWALWDHIPREREGRKCQGAVSYFRAWLPQGLGTSSVFYQNNFSKLDHLFQLFSLNRKNNLRKVITKYTDSPVAYLT